MNLTIQLLLWCCLQVTLLAVAALVFNSLFARRRPAAGAVIAASALFAVVGLSLLALSPWPRWHLNWEQVSWRSLAQAEDDAVGSTEPRPILKRVVALSSVAVADVPESEPVNPAEESKSRLQRVSEVAAHDGLFVLGVLYLVGLAVMATRFAWGFAAVRSYRRDSSLLTDRRVLEFVDVVCAELSCGRPIEVRESARLSTPATVGWRRPVLLLPADWRTWTDDECLAVLAHEIEHVRRGDFASWVAAQFGVALHFYHPLVHWLAARLRLQQELAADAAAARVLGGQRKYVTTLAAMALRQSDAAAAWPARAFLPTSKTFLRRIEMLHRSKSLTAGVSRPLFYFSVATVAAVALCAAGLRESAAGNDPQETAAPTSAAHNANADGNSAKPSDPPRELVTSTMNHLAQLGLAMHNYHSMYKHFPPAAVMGPDGKTTHSWRVELLPFLEGEALYREYKLNEPWDSPANKQVLDKMPAVFRSPFDDPQSTKSGYYVYTGPGTVFDGSRGTSFEDMSDGTTNTFLLVESKQDVPWTKPADIPFDPLKPPSSVRSFTEGQFFVCMADGSRRRIRNDNVKGQLAWLILRNDGHPIPWDEIMPVPQRAKMSAAGSAGAPGEADGRTSRGGQDINNARNLALAMWSYHDVNHHFPPAVVIGPDGKTPHSWRVEVLPYVPGAAALYRKYRMDEPWDSPANKQILEQMPEVFRSPYDDPKSLNSGYYCFTGPDTAAGASMREISDGTSNTFLLVSAKRSIPWTKPEDIPFDPAQPAPTLGGFVPNEFVAAMCDGSAHRFRIDQLQAQLKLLIQRNDGQPINLDRLGIGQQSGGLDQIPVREISK